MTLGILGPLGGGGPTANTLGTDGLTALESKSTTGSEGAFKGVPNTDFPALPRVFGGCLFLAFGSFASMLCGAFAFIPAFVLAIRSTFKRI